LKSGQNYPNAAKKNRLTNFLQKDLFPLLKQPHTAQQTNMKKTLLLGATPNPARYAYLATIRLRQYGHEVVPVGIRNGNIEGVEIQHGTPAIADIDTVTLYLNAQRQREYYDYILSLKPQRIIFNPGAENSELMRLANENGIETVEGCTLVMLSIGAY
jgi:uncharacterized protein